MAKATVWLKVKIVEAEADGSKCEGCGDKVFLRGYKVQVFLKWKGEYKEIGTSINMLCQSCGEVAKERYNG